MRATIDGKAGASSDEWASLSWDEDDDDPGRRRVGKLAMWISAIVLVGSVGVAVHRTIGKADAGGRSAASSGALPADAPAVVRDAVAVSSSDATPQSATTSVPQVEAVTSVATTTTPSTVAASVATTTTPSTVAASVATTNASPSSAASPPELSYATLPDGTPVPVVATFDVNTVTLTGAVPDQGAKDRLAVLSAANSKTSVVIQNMLTINPQIPSNVGVRVIELTSSRFDEGSAAVHGPHADELNRITTILNALPDVSALIIGHADQLGSNTANFQLSVARANSVVDYLVASGIDPTRLSARAVGESDLLSLNDDAASLALNRRTEVVFYGLFAG